MDINSLTTLQAPPAAPRWCESDIAGAGVTKSCVDTRHVRKSLQFEAWCDALSPLWDLAAPEKKADSYVGTLTKWRTENIVFIDNQLDGEVIGKPNSDRKSKDSENFGLSLPISGFGGHVFSGRYIPENPGDVILAQSNKSELFKNAYFYQRYVGLPYHLLGFDPSRHIGLAVFQNGTAANRLIKTAVDTAFDLLPTATPEEAKVLEDGFCALVRAVALNERPSDEGAASIRAARRHAMRKYVDEHLADETFGVEHLEQAFHVSSATVKRDFAEDGGLSRYLWRRRLECALMDLTKAREAQRGLVGDIAVRWGFQDESSFRRAFRREFGFAPSEALALATPETQQAS